MRITPVTSAGHRNRSGRNMPPTRPASTARANMISRTVAVPGTRAAIENTYSASTATYNTAQDAAITGCPHAAGQAGRKAGAEQIVSGACVQHLLAAGDSQLVGHAVHVREHGLPVPPLLRRMRRHTSAPVIFPPNAISNTSASGLVCGLWQCSIATAGEPVPHMTWKSLDTAEIIAHIASRANGSLSNTGDTDRPRRSPGHVIMSHAAHRGHGRSRTKPAIMRLLDTMLRFWPCAG